ncbi:hypothetical protein T484DRAFT_1899711 [Baffinella frigidus]|nr:hypothetical protein T484DRAFT_1899711 [Cryptophyta sp. CCMP2293]
MTLAYWYRHVECQKESCGIYIFDFRWALDSLGNNSCFNLWMEDNGIYWQTGSTWDYPRGPSFVEKKYQWTGEKTWRHVAWQLDEISNHINVSESKIATLGHTTPGWRYGAEAEISDVRMYVHGAAGPLTADNLKSLAAQPTVNISSDYKCLPVDSLQMSDQEWLDSHGHGCDWLVNARVTGHADAEANCPRLVNARVTVHADAEANCPSIQRLEAQSPQGTVDLGTPRVNMTDCDQLEASINEYCGFNISQVRAFTEASKANGNDFTEHHLTCSYSLNLNGKARVEHHPTYIYSLNPNGGARIEHHLTYSYSLNPNGEARVFTDCDYNGQFQFENVEMMAAENSKWTFLSISRDATTGYVRVVTNGVENAEGGSMSWCPFDEGSFFNAIEVNQPMLISPIMMVPEALPFGVVQRLYYAQAAEMSERDGPDVSLQQAESENKIVLDKVDYAPRLTLLSVPIVFQTRRERTMECPLDYSSQFIKNQHSRMVSSICGPPYLCSDKVVQESELTLS